MRLPNVIFLVDTSGSMGHVSALLNRTLGEIYNELSTQAEVGFATFNGNYHRVEFEHPRFRMGGGTELHMSICQFLTELTARYTGADKCLLIVITDGQGSRNFAYPDERVRTEVEMIENGLGWDFLFLGTDLNAYEVGARLGVKASKTLSFASSKEGFEKMLAGLNGVIRQWINGNIQHDAEFISDEMRRVQEQLGAVKFE